MKKYGLQLRVPPSQQKKPPRPPLPTANVFGGDDEEEEVNVEKEILLQANKNKSLKDIEEQHKKALEEDPSVFDYDGVYDEMKQKSAQPKVQDREARKPKYILNIIEKAKIRERENELIRERNIAKERSKEDHLYADKDKFVTSAYKRKLAENVRWMEEERLRQLREEKEDVTKKSDLSDFYFNLGKNVAFGGQEIESKKWQKQTEIRKPEKEDDHRAGETSDINHALPDPTIGLGSSMEKDLHRSETSPHPRTSSESSEPKPVSDTSVQDKSSDTQLSANQSQHDRHRRNQDSLAAARERFLARKRAKEQ